VGKTHQRVSRVRVVPPTSHPLHARRSGHRDVQEMTGTSCGIARVALAVICVVAASVPTAASPSTTPAAAASISHETHQHYSLTYLVLMLTVGAVCHQVDRKNPVPYTVTLLVLGIVIGLVNEATVRTRTNPATCHTASKQIGLGFRAQGLGIRV